MLFLNIIVGVELKIIKIILGVMFVWDKSNKVKNYALLAPLTEYI